MNNPIFPNFYFGNDVTNYITETMTLEITPKILYLFLIWLKMLTCIKNVIQNNLIINFNMLTTTTVTVTNPGKGERSDDQMFPINRVTRIGNVQVRAYTTLIKPLQTQVGNHVD